MRKIISFLFFCRMLFALEVGDIFPGFSLDLLDGGYTTPAKIFRSSQTVAVFTFFDSKCAPCKKELPLLQKVANNFSQKGVKFFMVAVGEEKEAISKCKKEWGIKLPVILDTSMSLARNCGVVVGSVKSIPKSFVVGKDLKVKKIFSGYHPDFDVKLEKVLTEVLSEKNQTDFIRIFYTNSANGIIESCDCPTNPYGGLVRRFTFFKETNADLKISAGDFFSPYEDKILNRYVLEIMEKLDYDAITPGDQEFRAGAEFLLEELKKRKLPLVISNLQICDEKSCYFIGEEYLIKEIKGIKIGITGVVSEKCFVFYPEKIRKSLKITKSPEEALNEIVPDLRKKCDLVFVIAHVPEIELNKIKKIPGIDVIFMGHTQSKTFISGKPVVVQAGGNGNSIGELLILKEKGGFRFVNNFYPLTTSVEKNQWGLSLFKKYKEEYKKSLEKLKK